MKIVVDTNVFVSAYFYGGTPLKVFEGWRNGQYDLVVSSEILREYQRVGQKFAKGEPDHRFYRLLDLISYKGKFVIPVDLSAEVCSDPDDDKFLACALGGGAEVIVSGDKALLDCSGYGGLAVLTPPVFVETYRD